MIHRVMKIGRWVVDFLFAYDEYDIDGVLACLYDAKAPSKILARAKSIMTDNYPDAGFTFSNREIKRAVVVIGPATSGKEFVNTIAHEIHHLAVEIADTLGVNLDGETPAYLAGDTLAEFMDIICRFGCEDKPTRKDFS